MLPLLFNPRIFTPTPVPFDFDYREIRQKYRLKKKKKGKRRKETFNLNKQVSSTFSSPLYFLLQFLPSHSHFKHPL